MYVIREGDSYKRSFNTSLLLIKNPFSLLPGCAVGSYFEIYVGELGKFDGESTRAY
jgi:hypothetical protein